MVSQTQPSEVNVLQLKNWSPTYMMKSKNMQPFTLFVCSVGITAGPLWDLNPTNQAQCTCGIDFLALT